VPCYSPLKKILCGLLAGLLVLTCHAQETVEQHKPMVQPSADFDQRFYYTSAEKQNVWGYRMGVQVNEHYKLGLGAYYMNKKYSLAGHEDVAGYRVAQTITQRQLYLGTVYYEPFLLRRRLWEASLVMETGYGKMVNCFTDNADSSRYSKSSTALIPAGAGLSLSFKPPALRNLFFLQWIGINLMGGYRMAVWQQDKQYTFNGAYWSLSGALFLDKMIQDIRMRKVKKQRNRQPAALSL
jgi:hypothetical protein